MQLLLQLVVKPFFALVTYLLDLHENIRFSKILSEYQKQPYLLEKTTFVFFFDPAKKRM